MAALTAQSHHLFTLEEIEALAAKENLPLDVCDVSLVDNGDGTHTYSVNAPKKPGKKKEDKDAESMASKAD